MSQIASGYVLTEAAMTEAARQFAAQDFGGAWNTSIPSKPVRSGGAAGPSSAFCAHGRLENGIELPLSNSPAARLFIEEFEPLICAEQAEIARWGMNWSGGVRLPAISWRTAGVSPGWTSPMPRSS